MAEVAILCTVYEAAQYLQKALDSVIAQTFPDWEMLVMDDGSRDPRVGDILSSMDDPRIRIERFATTIEERRQSCRYATLINQGVPRTTAPLLSYLCSDDFYMPDRLERMLDVVGEGVHVVYGAQQTLGAEGQPLWVRETEGVLDDAAERVDHNSFLHTRESFDAVGGWDDDSAYWTAADAQFFRKLTAAGYRFHPVPGPPTDAKHYHADCVGDTVPFGREPWAI